MPPKLCRLYSSCRQTGSCCAWRPAEAISPSRILKVSNFDIWLTFNGSYVRSKDTVLFKNPLDADDKHRILQNLKQMHRAAAISNEHFIVTNGTDPDLAQYFSFGSEKLVISEHFDALCEEEIYQIMCSCNSTEYAQILQGTHATQITAWWDKAVDIIPLSCGKGNAVRAVLAHYGVFKVRSHCLWGRTERH